MVAIAGLSTSLMQVISLHRFAIKGLSGDPMQSITIHHPGDTFPDDRRFGLLKRSKSHLPAASFDATHPKWIHKENFLCAFTSPELMATFDTEYTSHHDDNRAEKMLTIWKRNNSDNLFNVEANNPRSYPPLLGPIDLSTLSGREEVSNFFSQSCGEYVDLISAEGNKSCEKQGGDRHTHQFGNTRSGVKARGDTRTVHIVNAATVRDVSDKLGIPLRPSRFRANIIVDGLEPWKEFEFVGKTLKVCSSSGRSATGNDKFTGREKVDDNGGELTFDVITRTVRCDGISVDPLDDPPRTRLDMPKLLAEHYPQHGPFFGVYAATASAGRIEVGDTITLV